MSGAAAGPDRVAADLVRFVVLDTETTGLDPRRDRIVTIGAVGVQGGEILLEDRFEALLRVAHNTSAVTVHGVTRDDSRHGLDEALALRLFLEYLKDGVIVGHHIQHDVQTLNAGYERHFGSQIENLCLDTMDLALHLEKDGAFAGQDDRHTAAGDAFLTAQVFQRLLRLAARCGRTTLDRLVEPWVPDPTLD
jgi:DNA polymerase-3 subunit epsilon